MFRRLVILAGALLTSIQLAAEVNRWSYVERADAMTDEVKRSLSVENSDGHSLTAYPNSDGDFWLTISLGGMDQFANDRPPMLRIDKYEPRDFSTNVELQKLAKRLGMPEIQYVWNPSFVNIAMGAADKGQLKVGNEKHAITQFMKGKKAVLRYWLSTGGFKDTEFTLDGFAENAPKVFDLGARTAGLTEEEVSAMIHTEGTSVGLSHCQLQGCGGKELADEQLAELRSLMSGKYLASFDDGVNSWGSDTCNAIKREAREKQKSYPSGCQDELRIFQDSGKNIRDLLQRLSQ